MSAHSLQSVWRDGVELVRGGIDLTIEMPVIPNRPAPGSFAAQLEQDRQQELDSAKKEFPTLVRQPLTVESRKRLAELDRIIEPTKDPAQFVQDKLDAIAEHARLQKCFRTVTDEQREVYKAELEAATAKGYSDIAFGVKHLCEKQVVNLSDLVKQIGIVSHLCRRSPDIGELETVLDMVSTFASNAIRARSELHNPADIDRSNENVRQKIYNLERDALLFPQPPQS